MEAYRASHKDVRYTLDDFLQLRRNHAAYSEFYSTFLPPIVGRSLMKKLVADRNTVDHIATNTDEALALLGLENGLERWDDLFTRCGGDVRPYARGQEVPEAHKSTVSTKYTVPRKRKENTEKVGTDKHWSTEGIRRFNQLRRLIIEDRAAHPDFMPTWLAQERAALVAIPSTGTTNETDMPYADNDLGGSPSLNTEVLKPAAQEQDVLDDSSDHQASDSGTDDDHFGDSELI